MMKEHINASQLNFQPSPPNQIVLQDTITDESTKQDTVPDVKYQDIIYYMHNIGKTVKSKDQIHIDFFKAMSEMEKLDWTFSPNYIGFENKRKNEMVQFIRLGHNEWYADIPINSGKNWDGYYWASSSDNKTTSEMLRLFFEEVSWVGMLSWKMRKVRSELHV